MDNIPEGYCQCGCGQETKTATRTSTRWGHVAGRPFAFMVGHRRSMQNRPDGVPRTVEEYKRWWSENTNIPYGFCWCGCGQKAPLSKNNSISSPRFKGEPRRYIFRHAQSVAVGAPWVRKFRYEVSPDTGCWLWLGTKTKNGYGEVRRDGKRYLAHRYSYQVHVEPVPVGTHVHHLCGNKLCINPKHLSALSPLEHTTAHERRGENHPCSKLTSEEAGEIRRLYNEGRHTQRALASRFGISQSLVHLVVTNQIWR